uniref:UBC core domain-containing protein n=1 Tax=Arcella intermedia TaxID=1963864 RepID=A0A6B2LN37_9EUKA
MRSLQRDPHPNFDIYPNATNIAFWQIVLEVTEGSHYSGGTWLLYAEFPPDYPRQAPEIRFMTPIRHSNVNQYGKICHSIFSRNWTADTSMQTVLNCIYGLMLNPDTDDPLDTNLALSYFSATGDYEAKILAHVELYAKQKDRIAWRKHFQSLT